MKLNLSVTIVTHHVKLKRDGGRNLVIGKLVRDGRRRTVDGGRWRKDKESGSRKEKIGKGFTLRNGDTP